MKTVSGANDNAVGIFDAIFLLSMKGEVVISLASAVTFVCQEKKALKLL